MNRPRSNNPLPLIPSRLLLALILVSATATADIQLQAYSASYDLHKGGMHVATTELSLQRLEQSWRWVASVNLRGIYSVFVKSSPASETRFSQVDNDVRIHQIIVSDAERDRFESASFDWDRGSIDVLRKGKQKQLELKTTVFDYHSLHLLAAMMRQQDQDRTSFTFYRKGRLRESWMVYSGEAEVDVNGEQVTAHVFEHTIRKSKSRVIYYYDTEHPLLPLRIERLESGESPAILTLRKVEWSL